MSVAASHIKIGEIAGPTVLEEVCSARDTRKYPAAAAHLSAHAVAIGTNFVLLTESKCHFARRASLANSEASFVNFEIDDRGGVPLCETCIGTG